MAGIFPVIIFCLCFCPSLAFYNQAYRYQDIMAGVDQLHNFDIHQHLDKLDQIQAVQELFHDPTPHYGKSKAGTPWQLLHNEAQKISAKKGNQSSQTCQNSLIGTVEAFVKNETWARRSKFFCTFKHDKQIRKCGLRTNKLLSTFILFLFSLYFSFLEMGEFPAITTNTRYVPFWYFSD